jgi:uncharacterized protein (TIGR02679 family)
VTVNLSLVTGDADLAPLWAAIHDRLCSGADPASIATVRVAGLPAAGVATLRSWLDTTTRRRRGPSAVVTGHAGVSVPVREFLEILGVGPGHLVLLAERATGRPVLSRADARTDAAQLRQELWAYAAARLSGLPGLTARLRAAGVGDDDMAVRRLIDALASAVQQLPCDPPISLAKMAHDCAGDPHFFDLDRLPGARLVTAVAEFAGRPEPTRPDLVRALLADSGVIADRLTATVLLYRVRVTGDGPIDRRLRDSDMPVALTLLDLVQNPPILAEQTLTVVENPSVLEAAIACYSAHALACTSGHLGSVDHALLQLAADQGINLQYAGDIDDAGLRIAEYVARTYGAHLIAMDAETVASAGPGASAVTLSPLPQPADLELGEALRTGGRVVFQENEAVLRQLLKQEDDSTWVPGSRIHRQGGQSLFQHTSHASGGPRSERQPHPG